MEGKISYNEASEMDEQEIMEANAALDHYIDLTNASSRKGGKKR